MKAQIKLWLVAGLIILGGCCLPLASVAASSQTTSDDSTAQMRGGCPSPEETVTRMSSKLNLSDDQKNQILPIITNRQAQMKALMGDDSGRRMQKARKARSIMSESDQKIEAVLTSEQKKTYEQMKEEMREQVRSRMQQRSSSGLQ
ncbi:MAG TPA: hypothetical protein VGB69_07615 [Edaphobacter sp.]